MGPWIVTLAGEYAEFAARADGMPGVRVLRELPPGRAVVVAEDEAALARLTALECVLGAVPDTLRQKHSRGI